MLTLAEWLFSFSNIGIKNAAVFPDPVRAIATTSFPSIISGIVLRCIGVGTLKPLFNIALYTGKLSPTEKNG